MVTISGAAVFYELQTPALGSTGSLWCDPYGPFEVAGWRAVGPFILRQRDPANRWGHRKLSCSHARSKPTPCKAFVRIDKDAKFLGRRHLHNHVPEREIPPPLEHVSLPPAPSFEQIMATVTPEDHVMRFFRKRKLELFSTKMPRLDPESGEIREVDITEANALEISQMAEMVELPDSKKVWRCPVPDCARTMARRVPYMEKHVRHAHVQGVLAGAICPSRVREKLCPLCRQDQGTHQKLLAHIVGDHDTRLECTEHEFSSVSHYEEWKERAMREAKCFLRLASHKSKLPSGTFVCCKAGRTRRPEVAVNRSRLLGFECPASMIVELNSAGHVFVKFWRTHIGHTPIVLDVRCTATTHLFIRKCLDQNWNYGQVAAEACKNYLGGEIQRDQLLNYQDLRNAKKRLKLPTWLPNSEPKGLVGTMGRVQFRRLTLVKAIRAILEHGTNNDMKVVTDSHEIFNGTWRELPDNRYVFSNPEGRTIAVVFLRRSAHASCEQRCTHCDVCVHRYGCTCEQFLSEMRMCRHVHAVAQKVGTPFPSASLIDENLPDNLGYDEALWVLARLNYEERTRELITLVDELAHLIKGRHHIELDRLEDHVRSAVELLRSSEPVRESVEDEARTVLATVTEQLDQEDRAKRNQVENERKATPQANPGANLNHANEEGLTKQTAVSSTVTGIVLGQLDQWSGFDNLGRARIDANQEGTASQEQSRYVMRRTFNAHIPKRGRGRKYMVTGGLRLSSGGVVRHVVYRRTPFSSVHRQRGPTVRAEVIDAKLNPEILEEVAMASKSAEAASSANANESSADVDEVVTQTVRTSLRSDGDASGVLTATRQTASDPSDAVVKLEAGEKNEPDLNVRQMAEVKTEVAEIERAEDENASEGPPQKMPRMNSADKTEFATTSAVCGGFIDAPSEAAAGTNPVDSVLPQLSTGDSTTVSDTHEGAQRGGNRTALWGPNKFAVANGRRTRSTAVTATSKGSAPGATPGTTPGRPRAVSWSVAKPTPAPRTTTVSDRIDEISRRCKTAGKSVQWNVTTVDRPLSTTRLVRGLPATSTEASATGFALAPFPSSKKVFIPRTSAMRATSKIVVPSSALPSSSSSSTTKKIFIPAPSAMAGSGPLKLRVPRSALGNATMLHIKAPADDACVVAGASGSAMNLGTRPKMVRRLIKIIRRPSGGQTVEAQVGGGAGLNVVVRKESVQAALKQEVPTGRRNLDMNDEYSTDSYIESAPPSVDRVGPLVNPGSSGSSGGGAPERLPPKAEKEGSGGDSELNIGQVMRTMFEHDQ